MGAEFPRTSGTGLVVVPDRQKPPVPHGGGGPISSWVTIHSSPATVRILTNHAAPTFTQPASSALPLSCAQPLPFHATPAASQPPSPPAPLHRVPVAPRIRASAPASARIQQFRSPNHPLPSPVSRSARFTHNQRNSYPTLTEQVQLPPNPLSKIKIVTTLTWSLKSPSKIREPDFKSALSVSEPPRNSGRLRFLCSSGWCTRRDSNTEPSDS